MTAEAALTRLIRDMDALGNKVGVYIERTDARLVSIEIEQKLSEQHRRTMEGLVTDIHGTLRWGGRTVGASVLVAIVVFALKGGLVL
jgi:hypothetical protein